MKAQAIANFEVSYQIIPRHPEAHLFTVYCHIANPNPDGQVVSLPAWIPGSYMIRDFAKNIVSLSATSKGTEISVTKIDKDSWLCENTEQPLTLIYDIYAWDLSVRTAHLDSSHGFFNGTSVFLKVHGKESSACAVEIYSPIGEQYNAWRVATSLPLLDAKLYEFGTYQANDYDELVDHPVEMGEFSLATFEVADIPHDIVITGRHRADMTRLCEDLTKICQSHINLFGELPDIQRYVFLVMAVGSGYGGLEHRSSTSLLCSRDDLPLPGETDIKEGYRTFLGLCSHEYFHTWNIKRIKPAVFLPYDLSKESYTRQLWAFEGITSYYDDLGLIRSGVISTESYLELLGQVITRVWRGSGRFKQSVAESSFDAWTKFYQQDESAPNNIVSYYTKGSLLALALDLTIRQASENTRSLNELMQQLWTSYGKPSVGVAEGKIEKLASEIAQQDLSEFFESYLYAKQDPPLAELFKTVGINLNWRAAINAEDLGGKADERSQQKKATYLGARVVADNLGAKLSHVFDNGPAQLAGLSSGDIVVALNGVKVEKSNFEKRITEFSPEEDVQLHVFRRDELNEFTVKLLSAPLDTCYLTLASEIPNDTLQRRHSWLGLVT